VPVYIGPAPGWKGPGLGARRTTTEAGAKTISVENASAVTNTPEGDASAAGQPLSKSKLKPVRLAHKRIAPHNPAKAATDKSDQKETSTN
jgi:hypothetical protein